MGGCLELDLECPIGKKVPVIAFGGKVMYLVKLGYCCNLWEKDMFGIPYREDDLEKGTRPGRQVL